MPSGKKSTKKNLNIVEENSDYDDVEEFQNSEEEYAESEESELNSDDDQFGGDSIDGEYPKANELDTDSTSLEIDPDDEQDQDDNEDDQYDPINESEELEDPDQETDIEDEIEEKEMDEEMEEMDEAPELEDDQEDFAQDSRQCHMKNLNKDFIILDEDDSSMYGSMEWKKVPDEERESDNILTYYEMVRIIGTRAQQFSLGARPLVQGIDNLHPAKMAYVELISKMTPFIVQRFLPGKKYEEWRIDEMEIIHEISDNFFVPENFDYDAFMRKAAEVHKSKFQEVEVIPTKQSRVKSSRK